VPTGRHDGIGFGWGAYRTPMGAIIVTEGPSNKSYSMTASNIRYLDSIPKGHKSAVVNRAVEAYRGQSYEVHELLANIEALQKIITDLHAPESTSLMGGLRAILARMWPF